MCQGALEAFISSLKKKKKQPDFCRSKHSLNRNTEMQMRRRIVLFFFFFIAEKKSLYSNQFLVSLSSFFFIFMIWWKFAQWSSWAQKNKNKANKKKINIAMLREFNFASR